MLVQTFFTLVIFISDFVVFVTRCLCCDNAVDVVSVDSLLVDIAKMLCAILYCSSNTGNT
jgi:hypothetical protein